MNGGTVSMCVEKTIFGCSCSGHVASTFARVSSTGIFRASHPRPCSSPQRKSPTAVSFGVIDSISTSRRVSANSSMQQKSNSRWSQVASGRSFVISRNSVVASRWQADCLPYYRWTFSEEKRTANDQQRTTSDRRQRVPESSTIRSFFIDGPAGRLEALLNAGSATATHAAIVCHPHPLFGGTLHNKVVFHAMKALNSFGFPVLRFNFRGTGLSEGEHASGIGEVEDARAAFDWLPREFPLPIVFAGFSFGAAVGLQAAYADDRVMALIALGLPAVPIPTNTAVPRTYDFVCLRTSPKPKLFISGARDQFGPRAKLEELIASVPEPKKLVIIEGADHFFEGRLRELREA